MVLTAAARAGERLGRADSPLRSPLRALPPAHSPLSAGALARGAAAALAHREDPRPLLEETLGRRYGADHTLLCDSGTSALGLALTLTRSRLGGDPAVALPAFACYDVAAAAIGAGGPVLLYDLDPETLAPDPESLRRALAAGARIVVVAPLFGLPVDWNALASLAAESDAVLIEDAAQGHGATYDGRPLGALGRISTLSFGRGKGWTGGCGGALLRRGEGAQDASPPLFGPGANAAVLTRALAHWLLGSPAVYGAPLAIPWLHLGETRYRAPTAPRPMSRASAAILLETECAAEDEAAARRRAAEEWATALRPLRGVARYDAPSHSRPGWLRYPVRLRGGMAGLRTAAALRRLGVLPGYPATLAGLPQLRAQLSVRLPTPGADELTRTLLTLPTHPCLSARERARILTLLG